MCHVENFRFTSPPSRRSTSGPYRWAHRQMVVWSTAKPRSAISSSRSRELRQNRQYHLTEVTMTCGSNLRFRNSGGRQGPMALPYQIRCCNTSVWVDRAASGAVLQFTDFSAAQMGGGDLSGADLILALFRRQAFQEPA